MIKAELDKQAQNFTSQLVDPQSATPISAPNVNNEETKDRGEYG